MRRLRLGVGADLRLLHLHRCQRPAAETTLKGRAIQQLRGVHLSISGMQKFAPVKSTQLIPAFSLAGGDPT